MKRLILGLIMAMMATLALVGGTTATASAACPYSGCVNTRTGADDIHRTGRTMRFDAQVKGVGSTSAPRGTFRLKVYSPRGNRVVWLEHPVVGGETTFRPRTKFRPNRTYTWKITYLAKKGSRWNNSATTGTFRSFRTHR